MTVPYQVKPSDEIKGAPEVSYYTPEQPVPAGTFIPNRQMKLLPKFFNL